MLKASFLYHFYCKYHQIKMKMQTKKKSVFFVLNNSLYISALNFQVLYRLLFCVIFFIR